MKQKRNRTLIVIGILFLLYWFLDFLYNAVRSHDYTWLLWYSATGFFFTGVALVVQNTKLTYSMFCALFVIETFWSIDFFYSLFTHQSPFGLTEYILSSSFYERDIFLTFWHALIPVGILLAVMRDPKTYRYGWVGATIFASTLVILTYFIVSPTSQVNCVYPVTGCHTIFSFMYALAAPMRISIVLVALTIFIFIPSNYVLIYFREKLRRHA